MFSQRNAPLAAMAGPLGAAAIIGPDPRARTDLEHSPGRSERDPRSLDAAARRAAARGAAAARAAPPGRRWAARVGRRPACATRSVRSRDAAIALVHGACRPRQGRGRRDRRRGRQGRGARRARDRPRHLRGLPARHRDVAVARGVAPRLDGLGRPPRLPAVLSVAMAAVLLALGISGRRVGGALARRRSSSASWSASSWASTCRTSSTPRSARRSALAVDPGIRPLVVGMLLVGFLGLIAGIVGGRPDERLGRRSLRGTRRPDRARRRPRRVHRHHVRAAGRRRHRDHRSATSPGWP